MPGLAAGWVGHFEVPGKQSVHPGVHGLDKSRVAISAPIPVHNERTRYLLTNLLTRGTVLVQRHCGLVRFS